MPPSAARQVMRFIFMISQRRHDRPLAEKEATREKTLPQAHTTMYSMVAMCLEAQVGVNFKAQVYFLVHSKSLGDGAHTSARHVFPTLG